MSLTTKITARIRGLVEPFFAEGDESQTPQMNNNGEQIISMAGIGEYGESARLGRIWQVSLSTGVAAQTALPTTTAGASLYNGESSTGKSYVLVAFGSIEEVADATQTDDTAIFACMNVNPLVSAVPTDAGIAIRGTTGRKYGGSARFTSAPTITNDGWFGHSCESPQMAAAAAGAIWRVNEVRPNGIYVVRPGGQFNVAAVKTAAAALQQFYFFRWVESRITCAT